ncbi:virulence factor [Thioalkalivibrio sp. HK1]|uniref:virulence factor n=1 Tax=Thioalkalivibrio sp. HK1 TaxID=1469245 RepID=UPI000470A473|nr:virulence factor [Thioalkalivibrio sp. HK1]
MAKISVIYWQNIPSVVEVRDRRVRHKVELDKRFQELIDLVAMKKRLAGTDAYLEQWRKTPLEERAGNPPDVAREVADEIESRFDAIRADVLAQVSADE